MSEEVKESNFKLYDIEVYREYFQIGIKDFITKNTFSMEVSELEDDREKIYNWFTNFKGFLVHFNGLYYDNIVIFYFLKNYSYLKTLSRIEFNLKIKQFSDLVINQEDNYDEIKSYKYFKKGWIDIDLFCYWSKMLRVSKKISLKSLGIQLGYPVVQELPFSPDSSISKNEILVLREYNLIHDLGILDLLTTNMKSEIKLRESINKEYNLDCWSWDAPKIASEALLKDYCEEHNLEESEIRKTRFEKPTLYGNEVLKGFNPNFRLEIFKNLYNRILNSVNGFSEELIVNLANTSIKLSYGIGGLHSVNENETYCSDNEIQVETSDATSLYPNLIINYKCIRYPSVLKKYNDIKLERVVAKKNGQKSKDLFFKLILNSTSGLLDNEHSWLYYPEGALRLRLIGQIILTKWIEECIINNWKVVSANTDGIEVLVPKSQLDVYHKKLESVAGEFNLELEHDSYSKIVYKNVNNYIAITEKGKIKRKGLFKLDFDEKGVREIPLGDSVNELVIAKALTQYYVNNIKPEEVIDNPEHFNLSIYDFCKSNKISKDYVVYHNGKKQQNLNRYYFTKNGPYLFKQKKSKIYSEADRPYLRQQILDAISISGEGYSPNYKLLSLKELDEKVDNLIHGNGTMQHVNVGEGVTLFNNYEQKDWKDYNINKRYYISSIWSIINDINKNNQLTLF